VVRLHDGSVGMWYAGIPIGDEELVYRICLGRFPGPRSPDVTAERFPMVNPGGLLRLVDDMARRAAVSLRVRYR